MNMKHLCIFLSAIVGLGQPVVAQETLPGAKQLDAAGDLSAQMVAGIDRHLDRATLQGAAGRTQFWKRDLTSAQAYAASVAPNRERLRQILGAVDQRVTPVRMEYVGGPDQSALLAESGQVRILAVRWTVFEGVTGEGLLLEPKNQAVARIVALPDADQTPEMLAGIVPCEPAHADFARRLAEAGCEVLVPALIDRQCTWSGNPEIAMTDESHREWVWRPAFELGRHVIGFETQKVSAAVDWLLARGAPDGKPLPVAVAGYGEGGLIALCAAALDQRIDAALVSGYFQPREALWSEPIYRNVWGLLREFGDAEIASLIMPRGLMIEYSAGPRVEGPPRADASRRKCAAPGRIQPPELASVRKEVERARALTSASDGRTLGSIELIAGAEGAEVGPGSDEACRALLARLGVKPRPSAADDAGLKKLATSDASARQRRQVAELIEHCQRLLRRTEKVRGEYWKNAVPAAATDWPQATQPYRKALWDDVYGRLPDPSLPPNPRSRKLDQRAEYTLWEVQLDVWPDVFAWGYLLVPNDIKPGERRPVVVCQHGLEGLPASVVEENEKTNDWRAYRAYARRLAARGFVCFCPHNPYRGETAFRQLQRKAFPLGLSLFSFILGQHQRELEWLESLPFVDAKRIGFYGLSYGGVSALRIPALLDGYTLSICSAAFNDWPRKIVSNDFQSAYVFTREYDHFGFNSANTFSNAELAALIAPRPFMVERGHNDGVAPDEWVAHEYAKVRRLYARLGIPQRTEIEFFTGGHEIHGRGTFDFLHHHLRWPKPLDGQAKPAQ